jgi:iron complex outermembrane recepter protein
MKNYYIIIVIVLFCISNMLTAQKPDTTHVKTFELGEVNISSSTKLTSNSEITIDDILSHQKSAVPDALNLIPGITVSQVGGRNEAMVYVRGFDLRQVPVFIDGMPVYVPYDGYIDLARLQTANLSKITVSKGFSSMLYGANAMGGAINIISARPISKIEINGNTGFIFSKEGRNAYNTALSVGTRQQKWYAEGNMSYLNRDFISLASGFDTLKNEKDHKRDNSYTKDLQYQVKAGYIPSEGNEYTLSYSGVRSEKGVPLYIGSNASTKLKYWQYPDWNKDCYYLHSKSALSESLTFKTRLFYDKYYNVLKSFDNNTYTTQKAKSAFTSIYDDYTTGGIIELEYSAIENNNITLGVNSKFDRHKEYNEGQKARSFSDVTTAYAVEDVWKMLPKVSLVTGIGLFTRNNSYADDYNSTKDSVYAFPKSNDKSFNYQAGIFYEPVPFQSVYATIAQKSRFATLKDRYSYKMGSAIPNPALKSEQSLNTEIGYKGTFKRIEWSVAAFYDFIDNTIQQVDNVQPGVYQLQNTGKAEFRGYEASLGGKVYSFLSAGASYSFIQQKNISNSSLKFIDVPKNKVLGYLKAEKKELFCAMIDFTYNTERFSTSDGLYKAPECMLINLNAEYFPVKFISVKAGIRNLTDKLYCVTEGYPEEGRTFSLALTYHFSK